MSRLSKRAAFAVVLAALTMTPPAEADARARISTGQELYEACRTLAEHKLDSDAPTPRRALYCRQFIEGYFRSAKYIREDEKARAALGLPVAPTECEPMVGPNSYDQLADRIVRNAEWHPELLGEPAVRLARMAFGDKPPC